MPSGLESTFLSLAVYTVLFLAFYPGSRAKNEMLGILVIKAYLTTLSSVKSLDK
jgi:hypothetical protein